MIAIPFAVYAAQASAEPAPAAQAAVEPAPVAQASAEPVSAAKAPPAAPGGEVIAVLQKKIAALEAEVAGLRKNQGSASAAPAPAKPTPAVPFPGAQPSASSVSASPAPETVSAAPGDGANDALREKISALEAEIARLRQNPVAPVAVSADAPRAGASASSALKIEMVAIPGRNFAICKYEVTQELWTYVMGGNPSKFKGATRPVECVSRDDCRLFLKRLNALPEIVSSGISYRLPTASEWEYACRAGATGDYCLLPDGMEISSRSLDEVAWFKGNITEDKTHPVGQKRPNAFGLHDMHGNVAEWVAPPRSSNAREYRWTCCGGSWLDSADKCAASFRNRLRIGIRDDYIGLRLARDVK